MATHHLHLGPMSKYTTYNAEWVGLLLAIWLMTTMINQARISISNISIYTNNQSVIRMLKNRKVGTTQYIADTFQQLAETTRARGPRIKKFTMNWISAHSDVARNKKVDNKAKLSA